MISLQCVRVDAFSTWRIVFCKLDTRTSGCITPIILLLNIFWTLNWLDVLLPREGRSSAGGEGKMVVPRKLSSEEPNEEPRLPVLGVNESSAKSMSWLLTKGIRRRFFRGGEIERTEVHFPSEWPPREESQSVVIYTIKTIPPFFWIM